MCNEPMTAYVGKYSERKITVRCGNTSPTGYPYLCDKCEVLHKDRDWRREAMENGENFDDDY